MLSYQGKPEIKAMFQQRYAEHRRLGHVVQRLTFDPVTQHGCFIGCTMNAYDHELFGRQIGPEWLGHLGGIIFEEVPAEEAPQFGTDLLEAIPVGIDLDHVKWQIVTARYERQLDMLKDGTSPNRYHEFLTSVLAYTKAMVNNSYSTIEEAEFDRLASELTRNRIAELVVKTISHNTGIFEDSVSVAGSILFGAETKVIIPDTARIEKYQSERDTLLSILRSYPN